MATLSQLPVPVKQEEELQQQLADQLGSGKQPITEQTVSELLALPEFTVTDFELKTSPSGPELHLYLEHRHEVAICPRCQSLCEQVHEIKARQVRDLSWGPWQVWLHFPGRRFDCPSCGKPFTESLMSIGPWRRQTRRFERFIYQRCLNSSVQAVAQEQGLDWDSVHEIFQRQAHRVLPSANPGRVRVLGIDEIALKKRHKQYALVLSDLDRHCVLDVLESREKERLEAWLDDLSEEERRAIKVVSMDMWAPYRLAVQAKLPHAQIVADRFHVMKQLNERLTQMRRSIQRQADPETRQILKGSRWILVKNRDELTPEEEAHLQQILSACPALRTLYLLKEEFRLIFDKVRDRSQAERFLTAWRCKALQTGDPFLAKFVTTLLNWWVEILNYFDERITNGFVEGINRAIRTLICCAYGYRNFAHFALHVLARHGSRARSPTFS